MENKQKTLFIAEVKTRSPHTELKVYSWEGLFEQASLHGDWVSVHTNPLWGGNFARLAWARSCTKKPLLAKGLHQTDHEIMEAFNAGADYVLVVGRVPELEPCYMDSVIIEPKSLQELATIPHDFKVVWNSRNPFTGEKRSETFAEARAIFPGWLCQASNIKTPEDVHPGADAILVGQAMPEFAAKWRLQYPY